MFCANTLTGKSGSLGSFNDCVVLAVEVVGVIWIGIMIYFKLRKANPFKTFINLSNMFNKKSKETSGIEENTITSPMIKSDETFSLTEFFTSLPTLISLFEAIISISIFVIARLYRINDCDYPSSIVIVGLRIFGWVVSFIYAIYLTKRSTYLNKFGNNDNLENTVLSIEINNQREAMSRRHRKGSLYLNLGWTITAIITAGMNCTNYMNFTEDRIFSILILLYFVGAMVNALILGYHLIKLELNPDSGLPTNISTSAIPKRSFLSGLLTSDVKQNNCIDSNDENSSVSSPLPIKVDTLWATHRNHDAVNTWGVPSSDSMVDIRLSDGGFYDSESGNNQTISSSGTKTSNGNNAVSSAHSNSSHRISDLNKSSHGIVSHSRPTSVSTTGSTSWSAATVRILKEQGGLSGLRDIAVNIVEWKILSVNNKVMIVYRIAVISNTSHGISQSPKSNSFLGQTNASVVPGASSIGSFSSSDSYRSSRIIMKRLDELVYLRERILAQFPNMQNFPMVPMLSAQEIERILSLSSNSQLSENDRSPEYESHKDAMNDFLAFLVGNPTCSRLVTSDFLSSAVNNSQISSKTANEEAVTARINNDINPNTNPAQSAQSVINEPDRSGLFVIPFQTAIGLAVTGWVDVTIHNTSKIYYEVEVQGHGFQWRLRKRFRQFRALYQLLDSQNLISINGQVLLGPLKYSLRRPKHLSLSDTDEAKLNENTVALDNFMKNCLILYSKCEIGYPPALMAFLESDVYCRTKYYDIIKSDSDHKLAPEVKHKSSSSLIQSKSDNIWTVKVINDEISKEHEELSYQMRRHLIEYCSCESLDDINQSQFYLNTLFDSDNDTLTTCNTLKDPRSSRVSNQNVTIGNDEDIKHPDTSKSGDHKKTENKTSSVDSQARRGSAFPRLSMLTNLLSGTSSNQTSLQKLIELPGILLDELVSLIQFIGLDDVMNSIDSYQTTMTPQSSFVVNYDLLPRKYANALHSLLKSSNEGNTSQDITRSSMPATWISQWRIQNALLSLTAFKSIVKRMELLQNLQLKDLATLTEPTRLSFLLNLHNLISLHATVMIPWPRSGFKSQLNRILWQYKARFKIGSGFLSLLQLQSLMRAAGPILDVPGIPIASEVSAIVPPPSISDMKMFNNLAATAHDPRYVFALALPYRSSSKLLWKSSSGCGVYAYNNLQKNLLTATREYLEKRFDSNKSSQLITLPKHMRIYSQEFQDFRIDAIKKLQEFTSVSTVPSHYQDSTVDKKKSFQGDSTIRIADDSSSNSILPVTAIPIVSDWDRAHDEFSKSQNKTTMTASLSSTPLQSYSPSNVFVPIREDQQHSLHDFLEAVRNDGNIDDYIIIESELQRLIRILRIGIEVKDRRHLINKYKDCFLGCDFVRCLMASGDASSSYEAMVIGNVLMEYGYIRHVKGELWMRNDDMAFYTFTNYSAPVPPLAPYMSFLLAHFESNVLSVTDLGRNNMDGLKSHLNSQHSSVETLIREGFENDKAILWDRENYSFDFPILRRS